MKCVVLHESSKKIRIKIPYPYMSMHRADLVEYYIRNIDVVKEVSVDERTGNAVVSFLNSSEKDKDSLFSALSVFDPSDERIKALVPENTGREMNRKYEEKLFFSVTGMFMRKIFLPAPLAIARSIAKSIPYIVKGLFALKNGKLQVETLDGVAIATSIIRRDFDTASSIMFLLNIGETLEEWTRKKSINDLARSMSLNIDTVWLKNDGKEIQVGVNQVLAGDHIIVRNSEIIPLDGKVIEGEMTVNQSIMTGESEPVVKSPGGYVYAGTVVEEGECIIEVTKTAGSGKFDQIVRMIEESEKLKSDTEAKAYRLADKLVPYSLLGAGITYLLTRNATKALSFLMVDYSCAMKLSMPLAVLSAIKECREHRISVKGGKFMEAMAEADTLVFDKTGTLTHATPTLMDVVSFEGRDPDEMLRIAACLEEHYPHSVANAIVKGAKDKGLDHDELHSKVEYIVAHGISSFLDDERVVIGSYHFVMEDECCIIPEDEEYKLDEINREYSRIFMAIGGRLAAVLCIFDPLRDEAADVIKRLHELGFKKICMMTGDNKKNAEAVAAKLSLDEFCAEVLPEDKAAFIKKEHEQGHKVVMIGDGVNDTPALSEADVGIAILDGAPIAREIADITIASDDLHQLITLRKISTALMKRIKANYRFILGFNSALIAGGLFGVMNPASSALLHNGSTILTGLKSMTDLLPDTKNI
ncbi:MAG: heavy metal translocating P-type ATPase [Lachnospiraceae bacterium]|nr:heavy metal translocating P-type ATPase [Lachnospiraceae bacterium]